MASEEIIITTTLAAGGYLATKLFGTALDTIGDDINKLYKKGRDKIVEVAAKKVTNHDDGNNINLRAARDVLWNGAITDDEICAEYFGGMLAAARSVDGKDDTVVNYVDTIKTMSSSQLELHYVIFNTWHRLLKESNENINVAVSDELSRQHIFMWGHELDERKLPYDRDLTVLYRLGLVQQFNYNNLEFSGRFLRYVDVTPTTFGILLFAVAHNKINTWRNFKNEAYESVEGIKELKFIASDIETLINICGVTQ